MLLTVRTYGGTPCLEARVSDGVSEAQGVASFRAFSDQVEKRSHCSALAGRAPRLAAASMAAEA